MLATAFPKSPSIATGAGICNRFEQNFLITEVKFSLDLFVTTSIATAIVIAPVWGNE
jgi:hypothetical protein